MYAEFDEYTARKFKLVTRMRKEQRSRRPVSPPRFRKQTFFRREYRNTEASRETRDTFVSANCIIFNLYPVHAILDTVATSAQLVTPSRSRCAR